MVQSREPLLDCRGDGPEDEDEGQVGPSHEGPTQHARLLVKPLDITSNRVEELVGPGDGQELLPPAGGHVRDIETKDKGERDEIKECIEVFDYAFKQPETDCG